MKCPLCKLEVESFDRIEGRKPDFFLKCPNCKLVFRPFSEHISPKQEKQRYLTHNNSLENKGYVDFLMKAYNFAERYLNRDETMLDYGCGFNPVFTKLVEQKGWTCHAYDPFFFPNGIQNNHYRNIFCLETAEHFNRPIEEWEKLKKLMDTKSILVVMTEFWEEDTVFPKWHYSTDETHVSFYHWETVEWIARNFHLKIIDTDYDRIVVFQA